MNNVTRIGSFVLSCAIAGVVLAQAPPPAAPPAVGAGASASAEFGSIDQNKDGKVSSTEAQSNTELRSAFGALDADKDTYLSPSEFSKWNKSGKAGGAMPAPERGSSSNSTSEPAGAQPQSEQE